MSGPRVEQSGLGAAPYHAQGASLSVDLGWLEAEAPEATGPEEMLAVLEGALTLTCDGARHALSAGQGALIPAGARRALVPQGRALLYRVRAAG
ncbi:cupin domain-containing protein (plasmid) [Paroceanicella profunda]|uniref:Cupin domain-containing protein n=1 Tax=Paroceanicella profunda TaxID=2579971 RepID=A0A5B8FJ97_9RHOB|nr:cupin domain-containing protein [Paroceanicella profunda]QDL94671.1 cupin domain-containing protein [Paroceanicella profunda]